MSNIKKDAWEALQEQMEVVSALRGMHPEMFGFGLVNFTLFGGLDKACLSFHGPRELKYAFAAKHQDADWIQNELGNWNGTVMGIGICLFGMQKQLEEKKVTFPLTNEEADDAAGFPQAPIAPTAPMTPEQRAVDFCKDPSIEKAAAIMYGDKGLHPDLAKAMEVVNRAPGANPNPNPTFI